MNISIPHMFHSLSSHVRAFSKRTAENWVYLLYALVLVKNINEHAIKILLLLIAHFHPRRREVVISKPPQNKVI